MFDFGKYRKNNIEINLVYKLDKYRNFCVKSSTTEELGVKRILLVMNNGSNEFELKLDSLQFLTIKNLIDKFYITTMKSHSIKQDVFNLPNELENDEIEEHENFFWKYEWKEEIIPSNFLYYFFILEDFHWVIG